MAWRSPTEQLRRYLMMSLGLAATACGGAVISGSDDAGVTTDPSGDGSSLEGADEGTSSGSSTSTEPVPTGPGSTGPDTDTDDPPDLPKFDLPPQPDLPPLGDCTVTLTDASALTEHPECPIVLDGGFCLSNLYWGCVEPEPGQSCEEICPGGDCIAEWWNCAGDMVYEMPVDLCGPYEIDGLCCTLAEIEEFCGTDGRPFVVGGASRQAELLARGGLDPAIMQLPTRVRERLARRWAASARAEHASIASFAQFGAQLLALGAPASLVADALTAAADEAHHATFTLALASRFGAQTLEFGALDTRGAASSGLSMQALVFACVREGCVGETLAALELGAAARHCEDPNLAAGLRAIADDEARHAALAWRFVQWALDRAPELAPRLAALFESLCMPATARDCADALDEHERARLRAHGCLPDDERRHIELEGLRELILPCARALLATHDRAAARA